MSGDEDRRAQRMVGWGRQVGAISGRVDGRHDRKKAGAGVQLAAFVRQSGSGLLLPRLIPVGDPELDERIGGALDRIDEPLSPAL